MKKFLMLSLLIFFAVICSCQRQDSAAEQQLAQRKVELDAREDALIEREKVAAEREKALNEREKALTENEKATAKAQTIPPDPQSQDVIRDAAQLKALMSDPSQLNSTKAKKDRMTQERLSQRQGTQQESRGEKQYKLQEAQKAWMSGAALPPAAEAPSPTPSPAAEAISPTPSPAAEAISPTPSPSMEDLSPTESPAPQ